MNNDENTPKTRRGFAVMDPARVRELASAGGKAVHAKGNGHRFTSEEAKAAGRKGGLTAQSRRKGR
jgi:general stress protein YciG